MSMSGSPQSYENLTPSALLSPAATKVQAAAIDLFYIKGFRSTTVKEIMSACDLTAPAFYNHYPTKDALLFDIAQTTHDLCDQYLYRGLGVATGPAGRVWELTRAIAEFHAVHAKRARVTSEDFRALPPGELERIRERRRAVRKMFEHVISEGFESGDFDPPEIGGLRCARLLATSVTNMAIRISEWYSPALGLDPQQIGLFHADLAVRMMQATPAEASDGR
jgi:AcrR family transcriptional regulator